MKTLVNKNNPAIRITAPEIEEITSLGYTNYEIKQEGTFPLLFSSDIWNLVEEEYIKNRNDGTFTFVSTEEEPVNLEKEIDNYMDGYFSECQDGTLLNDGGSELQYEDVSKIAKYFYELGKKGGKI